MKISDIRIKMIKYLGSKCQRCGFNENIRALHIHHLNPQDKHPDYGKIYEWNWEEIKIELDKCILLCANCHFVYHMEHPVKNNIRPNKRKFLKSDNKRLIKEMETLMIENTALKLKNDTLKKLIMHLLS
jgi:predicted HNH restriction endonuclease